MRLAKVRVKRRELALWLRLTRGEQVMTTYLCPGNRGAICRKSMRYGVLTAPIFVSSRVHGGIAWGYHYGRDDVRNLEGIGGDGSFSAPRGSTFDLQIPESWPWDAHSFNNIQSTGFSFERKVLFSIAIAKYFDIIMQYHVYIPQRRPKRYAPSQMRNAAVND